LCRGCIFRLSALDPGKQGLKQVKTDLAIPAVILSALDPGKQGLKLKWAIYKRSSDGDFQRLIQENKD